MLGNTALTATLGATPPADADAKALTTYVRALAKIGLPVMFVEPGTKRPMDLRTVSERDRDNADNPGMNTGGVHLATTDPATLKKYVDRAMATKAKKGHPAPIAPDARLNLAVRLGGSGYIVADADTPGEVAALRAFLAPQYGGEDKVPAPTVVTPGSADGAHHGGGHWWFRLPEGAELDTSVLPATLKVDVPGHEEGFSLYLGNAYVLIPPSARPEGRYQLLASDNLLPMPIFNVVGKALQRGVERKKEREAYQERALAGELGDLDEQVATWSQATPWEDILLPHGWTPTGTVDSCGCPIWTAPGAHNSPKSATAHVHTCTEERVDALNPPLHLWTDNPGPGLEDYVAERGTKTVSKLNVWAYLEHGGAVGKAMEAAGIDQGLTGQTLMVEPDATGTTAADATTNAGVEPEGERAVDLVETMTADVGAMPDPDAWVPPREPIDPHEPVYTVGGRDMWEAWGVALPEDPEELAEFRKALPPLGPLRLYHDMPSTRYVVDGLLEHKALTAVIGDSGVGKSAVVLDMAACIVAGVPWMGRDTIQTRVLYVAGEGVTGAVERLHAWESRHGKGLLGDNFYLVEEAVMLGGRREPWAFLAHEVKRLGIGLVIFDTLARMSSGLEENSASDMAKAVSIFDNVKKLTGAGVCYVHHTTRGTTHGRGTTAMRGALDSEVLVTDTRVDGTTFRVDKDNRPINDAGENYPGRPLTVMTTKQKNGPDDKWTTVCMVSEGGSVVLEDAHENSEIAHLTNGTVPGIWSGESREDLAARVEKFVSRYVSEDLRPTISDIARGVMPLPMEGEVTPAKWRTKVNLGVDAALAERRIYKVGAGFSSEAPLDY